MFIIFIAEKHKDEKQAKLFVTTSQKSYLLLNTFIGRHTLPSKDF